MTRSRRIAFWLVVAVQALALVALIGLNERALASGDEVTLRTVPVDPVDLFRGNYVRLRYEISSLQVTRRMQPGDAVYVPLHASGDASTGSVGFPSPPSGGTFIRGTARRVTAGRAEVSYGIETYYADADEAQRLQAAGTLLVSIVVGDDGQARISRVERVR